MLSLNSTEVNPTVFLESYTVVLSVTCLILCTLFGSGGSLAIFIALCASKSTRKLRYSLFASVLVANLLFAIVWVPLEIANLLRYNEYGTVIEDVKFTVHSLYLLLLSVNVFGIVLISTKNLTFILYREKNIFHQKLIFITLVGNWILSFIIATTYGILSVCNENWRGAGMFHLMMNTPTFHFKVVLLTLHMLIMLVVLIAVLATARVRSLDVEEMSEESDTQGETSACLPTIQEPAQAQDTHSHTNLEDNRSAASSTAGSNKRLSDLDVAMNKRDKEKPELPSASKRRSSLQVNLANLLNRRRHTICQIGNTGTNTDPQGKSIQYNYVRKFSVDVIALQAQLENPKIHGGSFPFQSQQSLGEQAKKDLNGSIIKDSKASLPSIQEAENEGAMEMANQVPNLTFLSEQFEKRKSSAQRHLHDRLRQLRFCALLVTTYMLCVIPLYIAEVSKRSMSLRAYINTITCTTALSAIQIIIYPYLFLCMDSTINKKTHKLWSSIRQTCLHRTEVSKTGVVESTTTETNATQV